jgi:DMSO/TMAO reductase YedYZ molybdopterin-dependent catalytic subunit
MFATLMVLLVVGPVPETISVPTEQLPFDPAAWASSPQVDMEVKEDGKPVVYTGIPLARVLGEHLNGAGTMAELRRLSDAVILVKARDRYQAAVSAASVAMDPKGERYLLALKRDGKPLGEDQGPARLVIPGDPRRVRWVRMISSLQLVRLQAPK